MARVGCHPDIFRIGQLHRSTYICFPLQGPPDVWMRRQSDSHRNRFPADFVESVGESLELIVARTARRAAPHIDLPMVAPKRLQKVTGEGHMIGNGFGNLLGVDEVGRLAHFAIGCIDESDPGIVENLPELEWVFSVSLDGIPVRLDTLQSQRGDPLDCPNDIVLLTPYGTGGPEQDIRID